MTPFWIIPSKPKAFCLSTLSEQVNQLREQLAAERAAANGAGIDAAREIRALRAQLDRQPGALNESERFDLLAAASTVETASAEPNLTTTRRLALLARAETLRALACRGSRIKI